jgi:arylsulfatase A-like enzyme
MSLEKYNYSYSLYLSKAIQGFNNAITLNNLRDQFPLGLPGESLKISLKVTFDYFIEHLQEIPQPHILYLHVFPPHLPYRPSKEFYKSFVGDGYKAPKKPKELFIDYSNKPKDADLDLTRRIYDEFIMYCDQQFGEFYSGLEKSGRLDDTLLILTSDHGELNERGINGHGTESLFEPNKN